MSRKATEKLEIRLTPDPILRALVLAEMRRLHVPARSITAAALSEYFERRTPSASHPEMIVVAQQQSAPQGE